MAKTSRILFLLHLPPPVHGSSVMGLSIKESTIINNNFECNYINLLASKNVAESGSININKILTFITTWFKLLISITRKRPKLCYFALSTTGSAFFKDFLLVVLLKVFRINLIYHLHNKGISLHQHNPFYYFCYSIAFKKTEVILLSNRLYSDIESFVPECNIHICPNGIIDKLPDPNIDDLSNKSPIVNIGTPHSNLKQKQASKESVKILFFSNLIESKGVFLLLDACAILKEKQVQFECNFVGGEGDISYHQFYERVIKLDLTKKINYLGEKFGIDKNNIFSDTDIFAFPSFYETFGLVNLEAMQHSKPVISTVEGGIPDIVIDNLTGFLIQKNDVVDLANKLEILIMNPDLREKMGIAGRQKYEKEFTLKIFEIKLKGILQQVIEKKHLILSNEHH